jgi:CRP-like cAMP-binding protein
VSSNGTKIARFGPGDFFGEVAVLDGGARTATVVADSDMTVLVLSPSEFDALLDLSPQVARRVVAAMASRLRRATVLAAV